MEFKFDAGQEFQLEAIAAACGLFEGQPLMHSQLVVPNGASFQAIANRLDLDEGALLANLNNVQEARGIKPDAKLETIEAEIEIVSGTKQARFANFSVEMETGTGKTYVYLRTALDLFRASGCASSSSWCPSSRSARACSRRCVSPRSISRNCLRQRAVPFQRLRLGEPRRRCGTFALSDGVELMVMTIDAFNKARTSSSRRPTACKARSRSI